MSFFFYKPPFLGPFFFFFSDFFTSQNLQTSFFWIHFFIFTKGILLRNWIFLHFSTFVNTGSKILEIWDPIIQAKTRIFEFCKYWLKEAENLPQKKLQLSNHPF